jgi:hypothetical protein
MLGALCSLLAQVAACCWCLCRSDLQRWQLVSWLQCSWCLAGQQCFMRLQRHLPQGSVGKESCLSSYLLVSSLTVQCVLMAHGSVW